MTTPADTTSLSRSTEHSMVEHPAKSDGARSATPQGPLGPHGPLIAKYLRSIGVGGVLGGAAGTLFHHVRPGIFPDQWTASYAGAALGALMHRLLILIGNWAWLWVMTLNLLALKKMDLLRPAVAEKLIERGAVDFAGATSENLIDPATPSSSRPPHARSAAARPQTAVVKRMRKEHQPKRRVALDDEVHGAEDREAEERIVEEEAAEEEAAESDVNEPRQRG